MATPSSPDLNSVKTIGHYTDFTKFPVTTHVNKQDLTNMGFAGTRNMRRSLPRNVTWIDISTHRFSRLVDSLLDGVAAVSHERRGALCYVMDISFFYFSFLFYSFAFQFKDRLTMIHRQKEEDSH